MGTAILRPAARVWVTFLLREFIHVFSYLSLLQPHEKYKQKGIQLAGSE